MTEHRAQMIEQEKHSAQSITSLKNKVTRNGKRHRIMRTLLQEKLAQAMTDSLTDLPNRTSLSRHHSAHSVKSCRRPRKPICLAVCDIDHFKRSK